MRNRETRAVVDATLFYQALSISAVADGIVTSSGWHKGCGMVVEISHNNGFKSRYAHNSKNLVKVGDKVHKGQAISLRKLTDITKKTKVYFLVIKRDRK